jgi:hypothetical protein
VKHTTLIIVLFALGTIAIAVIGRWELVALMLIMMALIAMDAQTRRRG